MSRSADVLVVGGGIIGSAIAYYLAKEGVQVGLIERGDFASGTSSACDGAVLAIDKMPGPDTQMALESQKLFAELISELDYDINYVQRGSVLAVEDERQAEVARHLVQQQQACGLQMHYLEGNDVFQSEPLLARDVVGLVECRSDSSLYPPALVYGFLKAARRNGATLYPFTEVKKLLCNAAGCIRGISTENGDILAPVVVLAAGV